MFWFDYIIWFKMNLEPKMELIRFFNFLERCLLYRAFAKYLNSHLGVERPNSKLKKLIFV